jgi:hypothetical protein
MFGVDYPHFESIFPSTVDQVQALVDEPSMTDDDLSNVLFGNAARLYGLDPAMLQPHVDRVGYDLVEMAAGTPASASMAG